jgi:hypothetical protein|nr:MAG TPA_asm: hypothetical protein [Caudoviricetes sp.]
MYGICYNIKEVIRMKKEYVKEDFPKKAIYRKPKNKIPFVTDFKDGEMVEFYDFIGRPNAWKEGLAYYIGKDGVFKLINIKDLERV